MLSDGMAFTFSEDVFLLHTRDHKNPVIFGLFNTTRWDIYSVNRSCSQLSSLIYDRMIICLPLLTCVCNQLSLASLLRMTEVY